MKIHNVGPDTLYVSEGNPIPTGTSWIVGWYRIEPYEGHGYAIAKAGRKYYYKYLGHCSCFGPLDDSWSDVGNYKDLIRLLTFDNVIRDRRRAPDDYDYAIYVAILRKVKEIHGNEQRARKKSLAKRASGVSGDSTWDRDPR